MTRRRPIARLRDGRPVGAWLLKANPQVWDVLGAFERQEGLDRWRLAWSYRIELMAPGQPCALWVTGPARGASVSGVWAIGELRGSPEPAADDPSDPGWGPSPPHDVRPYVAVELRRCVPPLPRAAVAADPRLSQAEILRSPRMGSPLAFTPDEWQVVTDLLGD